MRNYPILHSHPFASGSSILMVLGGLLVHMQEDLMVFSNVVKD